MVTAAVFLTTACASTTETVYVEPECEVPPLPTPPEVSAHQLKEAVDEELRPTIERREAELIDALIERHRMLEEVCRSTD